MIGKLEELTLLAALQAGENAVASRIYEHLAAAAGPDGVASFGAIYTTLTRMAAKGWLTQSRFPDAAGKNRLAFTVSSGGRSELRHSLGTARRLGGFAIAGAN